MLLVWGMAAGGPQFRDAVAAATEASGTGRSPMGLGYEVCLSIDYLDFAPAAAAAHRPPWRAWPRRRSPGPAARDGGGRTSAHPAAGSGSGRTDSNSTAAASTALVDTGVSRRPVMQFRADH